MKGTLLEGNIRRELIALSLPLLIGSMLQQMYNTVDSLIISRYLGMEAFSAVGIAGTIMNLFIFVLTGFCTGISVILAQMYGSGDRAATFFLFVAVAVNALLDYLLVGKLGLRAVALATGVGWTCLSVLQLTMLWRIRKKPRAAN